MAAGVERLSRIQDVRAVYADAQARAPKGATLSTPVVPSTRPFIEQPQAEKSDVSSRPQEESVFSTSTVGDKLREMHEEREERDLPGVVESANADMAFSNRSIRFRINEDTEDLQIQIVDSQKDRIIRSIPSDEMIQLAVRIRELSGLGAMVDQSR